MARQPGFFDVDDRLADLSAKGDDLERLNAVVDFEAFRSDLEQAVARKDRSKGGRPAFDRVFMFKALILQTSHNLSDERTEYLIKDRLSFMRFLGLGLSDTIPDANTIWTFREALTKARIDGKPAIEVLFWRFDQALKAAGFLAMGGQIIDATIVAAPKQRNTEEEKRVIKDGGVPQRVGRYRLPLTEKRKASEEGRAHIGDPQKEAKRQAHARAHRQSQCGQIKCAGRRRACFRLAEGA